MTVNELLRLPADASQAQIQERVMQLAQNETDLLEVTGKDTIASAMGAVIAMKDAATELEKARAAVKSWEDRAAADEASALKRQIEDTVKACILDGRIAMKDTERQAQLVRHGEKFGIESLRETVAMMSPRPVRQFQAPPPQNAAAAQMRAMDDWMKANPGKSRGEAYIALSASNPALFGEQTLVVAVEE